MIMIRISILILIIVSMIITTFKILYMITDYSDSGANDDDVVDTNDDGNQRRHDRAYP